MKMTSTRWLALCATTMLAAPALADNVINDDLIVTFSACVGNDCANGESFGFDTLRIKENNLRIHFDDTSNSASFPQNDWRLGANDTSNGGGNLFFVEDATASRRVVVIEAGAPANALLLDNGGNMGLGTANPVVEMHVVDGDSPTMRLEQDGSSGFTPQTFDIAANETNFFVRDVTNGSQLPFRIEPGADTNALYIEDTNDIGIGTNAPTRDLHLRATNSADPQELQIENAAGGAVQLRLVTTNGNNRRVVGLNVDGDAQSSVLLGNGSVGIYGTNFTDPLALFETTGVTINGQALTVPDYVFGDEYELRPLAEVQSFIEANSHLPGVPSAADIAADGLNMTEMQMVLLKKIEELTLYTLEQDARIQTLESTVQR